MNFITIDCGASFIKGALFDNDKIIKTKEKKAPAVVTKGDFLTPVQIEKLIEMVKNLIDELAQGLEEITLCISNEMHGFLLSYEDGTPFCDYISWQKEYGNIEIDGKTSVDFIREIVSETDILNTGMPLRAGLPTSNLCYFKRTGILNQAKEKKLYFYTLGDYIVKRLSGVDAIVHPSNAAASGFYDLRTRDWNWRMIRELGLDNICFTKILTNKSDEKKAITFGLDDKVFHVLPALGDQQAALLGAGLEHENEFSYNLGTGSQVSRLVKEPICGSDYQIRPYFHGYYLKTIPHLPSGRGINVYIRFIKDILSKFSLEVSEDDLWDVILQEEKKVREKRNETDRQQKEGLCDYLICDMSFFENPLTDHTVGSISNIGEYKMNLGELMYGVFRQIIENDIWATRKIVDDMTSIKKVVFSGGIARKIESIREGILSFYPKDIAYSVAKEETMRGLLKYGQQENKE